MSDGRQENRAGNTPSVAAAAAPPPSEREAGAAGSDLGAGVGPRNTEKEYKESKEVKALTKEGNLAYEYERFEERSRAEIRELASKPKEEKKVGVLRILSALLIASVLLSMLIYTRVVQAELSNEYEKTLVKINAVKNENSRLQIELEEKLSLENLDEIAKTQIGLNEVRPQQIEYVEFDSEPKAEVIERHSFWKDMQNWWNGLFE